jgi:hypothetical protein
MALRYSPKITTDGLVMCLDASQNKSYPTDLPVKNGLALWLDAADDTTFSYSSGTSVSQWRDKSGNNRHFFQATVNNQPSRSVVINSRKAIQFTAVSGQYLRYNSTIINNTTGGSVFVVWRTAGETNAYSSILDNYHCGNSALNAGFQIERNVTNNQYYWGFNTPGCGNGGFMPATSYSNDTTNCIWITKDSTTITGGLNGTSGTPNASPSATWVEDTKGWTIGAWGLGIESFDRFFNGQQCEVIIFNRGLSVTERKQVNTYLGQKWGISNTDRSIVDLSNNNNNGLFGNATVANMPLYDFYNKGTLKFDGTNDYASGFGSSIVPTSTVQYTVSMWVYRTRNNVGYEELLSQWTSANSGNSFFFGFNNSNVRFTDNWNDVVVSGAGNTNIWMNLVGVYTVSNAFIYLNGVLVATKGSGFSYTGTGPLILGRQGELDSEYFGGNISNVLIYNKALSAAEVLQNYEAQKSKFANTIVQQGLVLNLDAGNIYSYAGAGATIYDVSGNSNNGTLTNSPTYSNNSIVFSNTANQSISISDTATLQPTSVTLSAWVYMTQYNPLNDFDGQFPTILWKCNDGNSGGAASYGLSLSAGQFPRFTVTPTQLISTTIFPIATWVNLVGVYTVGGSQILYRNGVVDIATTGPATISYSAQVVSVGTRVFNGTYQYPWNGSISNALIHNRALTATEVLQNYNATKGRFGL